MKRAIVAVLAGMAIVLATGTSLLQGDAPHGSTKAAEEAFRKKSYNLVISIAEAYLKTTPNGAEANEMRRLIGLSQVGLQQWHKGKQSLEELVRLDPATRDRTDVAHALARCEMRLNSNIDAVTKVVDHAIELYAVKKNVRAQVDLNFELAGYLTRYVHRRLPNQPNTPAARKVGYAIRVTRILKVYDRVLALEGATADDRVRALMDKARLVAGQYANLDYLNLDTLRNLNWRDAVKPMYPDLHVPLELAIRFLREVANDYPKHSQAPEALLGIAQIQEQRQTDFVAALVTNQELLERYPKSSQVKTASKAIQRIKDPRIGLQVTGVATPGKKPTFNWNARNVPEIKLAAYQVDLVAMVDRQRIDTEVLSFAPGGAKPVATWSIATGDDGKHKFLGSEKAFEIPLTESGAYVITASGINSDRKGASVKVLAIISRLA